MRITRKQLPYMAMENGCKVVYDGEYCYISKGGCGVVIYPNGNIVRTDVECHLAMAMKVKEVVALFKLS